MAATSPKPLRRITPPAPELRPLAGQKIAFAQPNKPGDTSLQTYTLTFSAQPAHRQPDPTAISPFFPSMDAAEVVVPAIQQLSGGSGEMPIQFFADYLNNGMGPGEVFAQKSGAPLSVGFNGKQSGGVATPNLTVSGLSRKFGTVSGSVIQRRSSQGQFDPTDIFQDLDAKLFGVVSLADLLTVRSKTYSTRIRRRSSRRTGCRTRSQPRCPSHRMCPKTYSAPPPRDFITLTFNGTSPTHWLSTQLSSCRSPAATRRSSIHGELNNFTLSLAKVVGITINQIAFDAPAGQKLSVSASMPPNDDDGPIQFLGDLSFLNAAPQVHPGRRI